MAAMAMLSALAFVLLVGATAQASGSSSPQPSVSPSSGSTTFRVGVLEVVDSLNPFISLSDVAGVIDHLNYDYLTGYDPVKLQPRPEFAESWTHSANGKIWTFRVRPGMTWQDGQPATARDVAFTFNYIIKNNLTSYTFYTSSIEKVVALNDSTVRFVCSQPKADILYMPVPILPEHIWSKVSPNAATSSFQNGPPCIGSGPFQVVEDKHNSYVRLVANNRYWRGTPHIHELLFISYTNANSMVADLKTGTLDAVVGVPASEMKGLSSSTITTNACTSWGFSQLSLNCYRSPNSLGNPVLLDPRFRQALEYAVNRNVIADDAFGGYMEPGQTLVPPYSDYHWQPPTGQEYTYDPAKAEALLDAAGYKEVNGFRETPQGKPITLRLYTSTERPSDTTATKLVAGWLNAIGVRVNVQVLDPATLEGDIWNYKGKTFAPDFDMYVYYWTYTYDPNTVLTLLSPEQIGAFSDTSWTDPAYTKLLQEESSNLDRQSRIAQVQQMQQIVWKASPYVIFGYHEQLEAYNSADWHGYVSAPSGFPGFAGAVLEDPAQIDTYLELRPMSAAATGSGASSSWIYALVAALVVLGLLAAWRWRRLRGRQVENQD